MGRLIGEVAVATCHGLERCCPFAAVEGLEAEYVDLSGLFQVTPLDTTKRGFHRLARDAMRERLEPLIKAGKLPVVTGYFGNVDGGIIKGVGRGYTDFTAALCAGATRAQE